MAMTTKANVTAQIPEIWEVDLLAQAESLTFWHLFEGPEGSNMPIIRKDDLTKAAGDTIKYDIVLALTGAGVVGDTAALVGNEEDLKFRQIALTVSDLSHAVKWTELAAVEITHNMRTTALNQLSKWLAGRFDNSIWAEITGNGATAVPSQNIYYCGSATSVNTIADSDTGGRLKLTDISNIKALAEANVKVEPLRLENGEEYYGLVLHPFTMASLKNDSNYQAAQREANVRGETNPLFTGASFVWDGVIGYKSNRTPTQVNSGSVTVSSNVFFGAQALSRGFALYPDWREEQFDYGRWAGVATTTIKGEKLNVFDLSAAGDGSLDTAIGSLLLYASATQPV